MIKIFRIIGFAEMISFLALLLIAMPLKYMYGMPEAVRLVGTIHGILFVLYFGATIAMASEYGWKVNRIIYVLIMASLPLGPLYLDRQLFTEHGELKHS